MTSPPKLEEKNVNFVLETVEEIVNSTQERRTGKKGEEQVNCLFLNELTKYCDDTQEQIFLTHPGAGTLTQKLLCVLLIFCVILFFISVGKGSILPAAISIFFNIAIFGVFVYKFVFDGTMLDFIKPKKSSSNVLGRRFAKDNAQTRVVLVAHSDSPLSHRSFIFGNLTTNIIGLCAVTGNTILFCSQIIFLFCGAPANNGFFNALSLICALFIPLYVFALFIVNPKSTASGISSALLPSSVILSILKQFSEDSFRYSKTEVCCLITGSEHSGRAGSYAFAKKYRRLFSDMPTIFIPIEEVTTSEKLAVFFKDGSGNKGSAETASVIAQAAENLQLSLSKENSFLGSAAFTPFSVNHFSACSVGTSKKFTAKSVSATEDKITAIRRKTISDLGALIIETLNYYDS